ncbi:PilZ domain-containing protein [Roseibium salinum]
MSNLAMVPDRSTSVTAFVVDLADMSCFEAIAHDLTEKGCWITSDKVDLLKEDVGLRLQGVDRLVRGTVVAYGDNQAQISFENSAQPIGEHRRETRRPVWITAIVCGRTNPVTMKCRIVDASKSGCRLEGDRLNRLPAEIDVSIPGLDLPIAADIVWRKDNQAGVRLHWPFSSGSSSKQQPVADGPESEKTKPAPGPKKRISAFGS